VLFWLISSVEGISVAVLELITIATRCPIVVITWVDEPVALKLRFTNDVDMVICREDKYAQPSIEVTNKQHKGLGNSTPSNSNEETASRRIWPFKWLLREIEDRRLQCSRSISSSKLAL